MGAQLVAEQITDPSNARTIYLTAGGLVVLALAVAAGTVWWWRSSKVEHPALGPLEVMGTRSWWKGDYAARRRRLAAARPAGAEPDPSLVDAFEQIDLQAAASSPALQFDDLLEVASAAEVPPVTDMADEPSLPALTEQEAPDGLTATDAADDASVTVADSTPVKSANGPIVISTAAAPATPGSPVVSSATRPLVTPEAEASPERRAPIDPLLRQAPSE